MPLSKNIERGDIYYADLGQGVGSEQYGTRPVLVIQNDMGNKHSPTVIVAAITSRLDKTMLPTHVCISSQESGLPLRSIVLLEQIKTVDKARLTQRVGSLDVNVMERIDHAICVSVGILSPQKKRCA